MLRLAAATLVLAWSSLAAAQIVFEPATPPDPYEGGRYPRHLTLHQLSLLKALTPQRGCNIAIHTNGPVNVSASPADQSIITRQPASSSADPTLFDPRTGQPLFFRMKDLLPPAPTPSNRDLTPQSAPPQPGGPPPGTIIIKPWRGGAEKLVSR